MEKQWSGRDAYGYSQFRMHAKHSLIVEKKNQTFDLQVAFEEQKTENNNY